jgi:hypothetical protein
VIGENKRSRWGGEREKREREKERKIKRENLFTVEREREVMPSMLPLWGQNQSS